MTEGLTGKSKRDHEEDDGGENNDDYDDHKREKKKEQVSQEALSLVLYGRSIRDSVSKKPLVVDFSEGKERCHGATLNTVGVASQARMFETQVKSCSRITAA